MSNVRFLNIKNLMKVNDNLIKIFFIRVLHTTSTIIATYISIILLDFNYSKEQIGIVLAVIGISYAVISIVAGALSDKFGRKRIFNLFKTITIVLMAISIMSFNSSITPILLIIVICINNGLDPVIVSAAIDFSRNEQRRNVFSILQLGSSVGMAAISLIASYLFDLNINVFFSLLIIVNIIPMILLNNIYKNYNQNKVVKKDTEVKVDKDNKEGNEYLKIIKKNIPLILFSIILITFSIAASQQNYGLNFLIGDMYKDKADISKWVGRLNFIYYFSIFIFNLIVTKLTKKYSSIVNLIIAGVIYTISMALIAFSGNVILIIIAMSLWGIAQLLININNGLFIADNSTESNRGINNAIFTTISGSGTVIGPLVSGYILKSFGIYSLWQSMVYICVFGSASMYCLYYLTKKKKLKNLINIKIER